MPVRRRMHDRLGADVAASSRRILDDVPYNGLCDLSVLAAVALPAASR
jgi:hypothetical protein